MYFVQLYFRASHTPLLTKSMITKFKQYFVDREHWILAITVGYKTTGEVKVVLESLLTVIKLETINQG